jgi:hypothetical protein
LSCRSPLATILEHAIRQRRCLQFCVASDPPAVEQPKSQVRRSRDSDKISL